MWNSKTVHILISLSLIVGLALPGHCGSGSFGFCFAPEETRSSESDDTGDSSASDVNPPGAGQDNTDSRRDEREKHFSNTSRHNHPAKGLHKIVRVMHNVSVVLPVVKNIHELLHLVQNAPGSREEIMFIRVLNPGIIEFIVLDSDDHPFGEVLVEIKRIVKSRYRATASLLENKHRSKIFTKIGSSPGLHFTTLSQVLGINRGTLRYHLSILVSARKIIEMEYYGKTLYFCNNGMLDESERKLIAHLQNPARLAVLLQLHAHGRLRRTDLIERSLLSTAAITWHLKNLHNEGIVDVEKIGRDAYYSVRPAVQARLEKHLIPGPPWYPGTATVEYVPEPVLYASTPS